MRSTSKQLAFACLIFIQCLFVFGQSKVFGQENISITLFGMPQRTFMLGPSGAENAAIIKQTYAPDESRQIHKTSSYNFSFGFLFKKHISLKTSFGWGFQYAPVEQKYKTFYKVRNEEIASAIRLKYIKVPVFIQYNYLLKEKRKFFCGIGPQLNILMGENGEMPVYGSNGLVPIFDLIDPGGAYRNFVVGGFFSTGIEFNPDDKLGVSLAAYVDVTLSPVEKREFVYFARYANDIYGEPNVTIRTKHVMTLGITLGFIFKVRRGL